MSAIAPSIPVVHTACLPVLRRRGVGANVSPVVALFSVDELAWYLSEGSIGRKRISNRGHARRPDEGMLGEFNLRSSAVHMYEDLISCLEFVAVLIRTINSILPLIKVVYAVCLVKQQRARRCLDYYSIREHRGRPKREVAFASYHINIISLLRMSYFNLYEYVCRY